MDRKELYRVAKFHEHMAAQAWKAYWDSLDMPGRPLTPEQVAMTKKIAPRTQRVSAKIPGIIIRRLDD